MSRAATRRFHSASPTTHDPRWSSNAPNSRNCNRGGLRSRRRARNLGGSSHLRVRIAVELRQPLDRLRMAGRDGRQERRPANRGHGVAREGRQRGRPRLRARHRTDGRDGIDGPVLERRPQRPLDARPLPAHEVARLVARLGPGLRDRLHRARLVALLMQKPGEHGAQPRSGEIRGPGRQRLLDELARATGIAGLDKRRAQGSRRTACGRTTASPRPRGRRQRSAAVLAARASPRPAAITARVASSSQTAGACHPDPTSASWASAPGRSPRPREQAGDPDRRAGSDPACQAGPPSQLAAACGERQGLFVLAALLVDGALEQEDIRHPPERVGLLERREPPVDLRESIVEPSRRKVDPVALEQRRLTPDHRRRPDPRTPGRAALGPPRSGPGAQAPRPRARRPRARSGRPLRRGRRARRPAPRRPRGRPRRGRRRPARSERRSA